jgi:alanine racemase
MNRLGFDDVDLETLFKYTSDESLKIVSVFSHLAASENEMHDDYTQEQLNRFDRLYAKLRLKFQKDFIRHISNTAGILRFPEAQYEMVRLGIGLYGIENVGHFQNELQMVGELKTTVTQIKKLKANDTVGYGRRGVINKDSEIATIKIGYADGYYRSFGYGNAYVSIKGQRAPVIGSVCMDMCMVDVTGLGVVEGDEVIIFGEDPSINDLAKIANTIPYEILTSISQRVQRIYYYE